jgi:hypothetical protein
MRIFFLSSDISLMRTEAFLELDVEKDPERRSIDRSSDTSSRVFIKLISSMFIFKGNLQSSLVRTR